MKRAVFACQFGACRRRGSPGGYNLATATCRHVWKITCHNRCPNCMVQACPAAASFFLSFLLILHFFLRRCHIGSNVFCDYIGALLWRNTNYSFLQRQVTQEKEKKESTKICLLLPRSAIPSFGHSGAICFTSAESGPTTNGEAIVRNSAAFNHSTRNQEAL